MQELNVKGPVMVLIADDDELFLHIAKRLMQEEGFFVVTAKSGWEVLKITKEICPDLIITDSNMPLLSGEAVCKYIKNNKSLKAIPIIILSGLEDEDSLKRFEACGCDDYFPKSKLSENFRDALKSRVYKALKNL